MKLDFAIRLAEGRRLWPIAFLGSEGAAFTPARYPHVPDSASEQDKQHDGENAIGQGSEVLAKGREVMVLGPRSRCP